MRGVMAVVALVLLAGCSDPADEAEPTAMLEPTTDAQAPATPQAPTVEVIAVAFDGKLGTQVHGCVFPAGVCPTHAVVPDSSDLVVERPGAVVTAIDLTATWTSATPATATLHFGFMVMASCDGCNDTTFGDIEGPSPIQMQATGVAVPLTADHVVHVYAYNPTGFVYDPNVPGYALVSAEQAFHIEGTITLEIPPAGAATSSGPAA